jgi:hypothetical protein
MVAADNEGRPGNLALAASAAALARIKGSMDGIETNTAQLPGHDQSLPIAIFRERGDLLALIACWVWRITLRMISTCVFAPSGFAADS